MRNSESDMRDRHENVGIIVMRVPEKKVVVHKNKKKKRMRSKDDEIFALLNRNTYSSRILTLLVFRAANLAQLEKQGG